MIQDDQKGEVEMKDTKIRKAVKEGYANIARRESSCCSPVNSCCTPTDSNNKPIDQADDMDLSKQIPQYIQESYDKIVNDLPEEEIQFLKETYWQK